MLASQSLIEEQFKDYDGDSDYSDPSDYEDDIREEGEYIFQSVCNNLK